MNKTKFFKQEKIELNSERNS